LIGPLERERLLASVAAANFSAAKIQFAVCVRAPQNATESRGLSRGSEFIANGRELHAVNQPPPYQIKITRRFLIECVPKITILSGKALKIYKFDGICCLLNKQRRDYLLFEPLSSKKAVGARRRQRRVQIERAW
jgi:hypothetical protein